MSRLVRRQGLEYDAAHGCVEATRQLIALLNDPDPEDSEDDGDAIDEALHLLCLECDRSAADAAFATRPRTADAAACFKLLRDAGANLEGARTLGYTPLHCAASEGRLELLTLLIQSGVNVDAVTDYGTTSLHLAARKGAADCVKVLLAAGADVHARSNAGRSAFDEALAPVRNVWTRAREEHNRRRTWPLFLRAGAELPTDNTDPYIVRVKNAGGFKKYAQAHLARIALILETPLLPPELVRKVLEFWLHAGYY